MSKSLLVLVGIFQTKIRHKNSHETRKPDVDAQRDAHSDAIEVKECQETKPKMFDELKKLHVAYREESQRLEWDMVEELRPHYLLHKEEAERTKDNPKAQSLHRWHVEEARQIAAKYNAKCQRRRELSVKRLEMFKEIQALQSQNGNN